jgi:hypothetical protein
MEQYNKFFDFLINCNDQIDSHKILGPLNGLFNSFGLNNIGDGICFVFIRCCQYTEHFTISLLNEMNSKFQEQLIKTTEIVKESINKLFHEQELKINKIKSENEELKTLVHNCINEIYDLKQNTISQLNKENKQIKSEICYVKDLINENEENHKQIKSEICYVKDLMNDLMNENDQFKCLFQNFINEIDELKEHNKCLSERILSLEIKPPLILY